MAELDSPVRPFTDAERAKIEEQVQTFYDQFVAKVAEARKSTPEKIDAVARGRVWTGRQAKKIGLVDELGGLDRAVAIARQRAKIPAGTRRRAGALPAAAVAVRRAEPPARPDRGIEPAQRAGAVRPRRSAGSCARSWRRCGCSGGGEPLALMPFVFTR